jgi:N-acyl-D-aspartate/D-glutamate deacylase
LGIAISSTTESLWLAPKFQDFLRLSLGRDHYKLSYLPVFMGGFQDRGFLCEGVSADVVVYDFENLKAMDPEVLHELPGDEWRRVQRA